MDQSQVSILRYAMVWFLGSISSIFALISHSGSELSQQEILRWWFINFPTASGNAKQTRMFPLLQFRTRTVNLTARRSDPRFGKSTANRCWFETTSECIKRRINLRLPSQSKCRTYNMENIQEITQIQRCCPRSFPVYRSNKAFCFTSVVCLLAYMSLSSTPGAPCISI